MSGSDALNVLITGAGQLACDLLNTAPGSAVVRRVGRSELDITQADACHKLIAEIKPDIVINAAAYTAVDKAESDVELAYSVNEQGVANLATACRAVGARLFHVSTDFVFDGGAHKPYLPDDPTAPESVYGASKRAGEVKAQQILPGTVVVRTGWLYSCNGNNFVKTMLRLMAERPELGVVVDQVGTPTWAKGLAEMLWQGASREVAGGVYHWSDAGVASWYDFAVAIQDEGLALGILDTAIPIKPISSLEFPTAAKRPAYSVLDKRMTEQAFGVACSHWRHQLHSMMSLLR